MVSIVLDAHLSPTLALWLNENFDNVKAISARALGLLQADDKTLFEEAGKLNAILISKDSDFVGISQRKGFPPMVVHLTIGNSSTQALRELFGKHLQSLLDYFAEGQELVVIS